MIDTTIDAAKSVLHMQIVPQMQSPLLILEELQEFLDKKSWEFLEALRLNGLINEIQRTVMRVELLELEENIPFVEIPEILSQKGLESPSIESILDMLFALKSKRSAEIRKVFFKNGFMLLSMEPILVDGKIQYVVIAENPCPSQSEDQWIYSLRLLNPPEIFSCKFYRLITVKKC